MTVKTGLRRCFVVQRVIADTLAPLLTPQSDSQHMSYAVYIVGLGKNSGIKDLLAE